jgi:hypothetical protein
MLDPVFPDKLSITNEALWNFLETVTAPEVTLTLTTAAPPPAGAGNASASVTDKKGSGGAGSGGAEEKNVDSVENAANQSSSSSSASSLPAPTAVSVPCACLLAPWGSNKGWQQQSLVLTVPPCAESDSLDNAAQVAGNVAVVARGLVGFVDKVQRSIDAGAIGVIITNNDSDNPDR